MEETLTIRDVVQHRLKDIDKILSALAIQDALRRKTGGKESEDIIREWREAR